MINHKFVLTALVLIPAVAATARAGTSAYTATLAQPLAAPREVVALENVWRCKDDTCRLVSKATDGGSVHSCNALRRQVGTLTSYGTSEHPLGAADLAKCNSGW